MINSIDKLACYLIILMPIFLVTGPFLSDLSGFITIKMKTLLNVVVHPSDTHWRLIVYGEQLCNWLVDFRRPFNVINLDIINIVQTAPMSQFSITNISFFTPNIIEESFRLTFIITI